MTSEVKKEKRFSYTLSEMKLLQPDCIFDPPEMISRMPWLFKCCERQNCIFHSHVSPKTSTDRKGSPCKSKSSNCETSISEEPININGEKNDVINDFEKLISDLNIKVMSSHENPGDIENPETTHKLDSCKNETSSQVVDSIEHIFGIQKVQEEPYVPLRRDQLKDMTPISVLRKLTYVPPRRHSATSDESSNVVSGCRPLFDHSPAIQHSQYHPQGFTSDYYYSNPNWESRSEYVSYDFDGTSSIRYAPSGATIFAHERRVPSSGMIYPSDNPKNFDMNFQNKVISPNSTTVKDPLSELYR